MSDDDSPVVVEPIEHDPVSTGMYWNYFRIKIKFIKKNIILEMKSTSDDDSPVPAKRIKRDPISEGIYGNYFTLMI